MKTIKKILCVILAAVLLLGGTLFGEKEVWAAKQYPAEFYLKQTRSGTCTLCSAAMMLRSAAYLKGNNNWNAITENGIRSKAWMEGVGLYWSWSYSIGDCSFKVNRSSLRSPSASSLRAVLDIHPEGIVLYCGGVPHAVFLTDYEGDTFYCADTTGSYSGSRIPLESSYLGNKLGSQSNILNNVTAYWYLESYNVPSHAVPEPTGLPFSDIYKSDWYFDAVAYVYQSGIMTGMSERIFGPTEPLSRAQFAVMLHRLESSPDVGFTPAFSDVGDGIWYTKAILWANANGIITGYDDGRFGIDDVITREQAATILYRYAKYKGIDVGVSGSVDGYIDGSHVSTFAKEAMGWSVVNGIITGKDFGTRLAPLETAARAECAVIFMRYMEKFGI